MLTHELKNPLGTITFAATSVKRKLLNDTDSLQRFKHIDLCITRMNKLIEHVARSSKIDRLHELGPVENIPAAALMHDLIEEYADNQRFILEIEDELTFRANREMLTVIFENLISNAYKYAHAASTINISIHSEVATPATIGNNQNHICFNISNTAGVFGIPDENRLFERYYRHSHSQSIPGLGIGLSLVKAAAQKIGAAVNYHHEYSLIIFTVRIPN
jgi:signal transduction histidine kinase